MVTNVIAKNFTCPETQKHDDLISYISADAKFFSGEPLVDEARPTLKKWVHELNFFTIILVNPIKGITRINLLTCICIDLYQCDS